MKNNTQGLIKLKKPLKEEKISLSTVLFCCENTGLYNHQLLTWCEKENVSIWVESAMAIKKSLGLVRGKDDAIDSYRIALYALRFEERCSLWKAPRPVIKQMKRLLSARKTILKLKKQSEQSLNELKAVGDLDAYKTMHIYFTKIMSAQKSPIQKI